MKYTSFILMAIVAVLLGQTAFAAFPTDITTNRSYLWTMGAFDEGLKWALRVENSIAGQRGTGKSWYVDSNVSNAGGGVSPEEAYATVDAAINRISADGGANRGDTIWCLQGHAESGIVADLFDADVAGISIRGIGTGSLAPTFTFAHADTTVAVGAANVLFENLRFLAGITEVVAGVIVEAAGDNFVMLNCVFPEPTTAGFEFNIAVQLTTAADNLSFIGNTAYSADEAGADHWLNGGAGVVNGLRIIGNTIHGEYAIAPIFSDQADLETYIRYNDITQLTASQFGIEFSAAATGIVADNRVNATVLFEVDPGSMAYWQNMEGDTLPEGVSLNGQLGAFTGPAAGGAQDDNVKASLDLAHTDLDTLIARETGTTLTAGKSYTVTAATASIIATTSPLFTIANGPIRITDFVGVANGAIGNSNMLIQSIATAGPTTFPFSTSVALDGDPDGTMYTFTGAVPGVLTPLIGAQNLSSGAAMNWYGPVGTIDQLGDAAVSGIIDWYMTFIPLVDGVTVTDAT